MVLVRWYPVNAQPVEEWLQEVVMKETAVEWQLAQFAAANALPAAAAATVCTGLLVLL